MQGAKRRKILYIIMSVVFGLYALSLLFPFYFIILNSFKTNGEFIENVYAFPLKLFKQSDIFRNYSKAFEDGTLFSMFVHTAVLTVFGTILGTLTPAVVAYVLAKYKFKLGSVIFTTAIIFMVVPQVGGTVSTYMLFINLNLLNTYWGMLMLYAAPFGGFFLLLYGYFKTVSWSYAEAAFIDGAGDFTVFFRIMLPQARAGLSAIALLVGLGIWNDYFGPYMYMPNIWTLGTGLQNMSYNAVVTGDYTPMFASMVMVAAPVVILFACTQKVLINNTVAGGLKG